MVPTTWPAESRTSQLPTTKSNWSAPGWSATARATAPRRQHRRGAEGQNHETRETNHRPALLAASTITAATSFGRDNIGTWPAASFVDVRIDVLGDRQLVVRR